MVRDNMVARYNKDAFFSGHLNQGVGNDRAIHQIESLSSLRLQEFQSLCLPLSFGDAIQFKNPQILPTERRYCLERLSIRQWKSRPQNLMPLSNFVEASL